jgi:hypothetical protein
MPESVTPASNSRWHRTIESSDFFIDEDRLRLWFYLLMAAGIVLLSALAAGLWQLQRAALAPPVFVGISHGLIFTGKPEGLASVTESDFDRQLADTVQILFTRTEKGLPPEISEFCASDVRSEVDRAYREAAAKYPAGYAQTFALLEARTIASRQGFRRVYYRGLLSSRSVGAAQTSPIYLDCTFIIRTPSAINPTGWRLTRADALSRDDYYREESERSVRRTLELPADSEAKP